MADDQLVEAIGIDIAGGHDPAKADARVENDVVVHSGKHAPGG